MPACIALCPGSTLARTQCRPRCITSRRIALRASAETADGAAASGTQAIRLTLRKPLGLVLGERVAEEPEVFIEEVSPGGNADKDGRLKAGDVLVRCSATILKAGKEGSFEREGYGERVLDNWDRVMFNARGKKFDTVMAALGSNSERWGIFTVDLEFERQAAAGAGEAAQQGA